MIASHATIAGGAYNYVDGHSSCVSGGYLNTVQGAGWCVQNSCRLFRSIPFIVHKLTTFLLDAGSTDNNPFVTGTTQSREGFQMLPSDTALALVVVFCTPRWGTMRKLGADIKISSMVTLQRLVGESSIPLERLGRIKLTW